MLEELKSTNPAVKGEAIKELRANLVGLAKRMVRGKNHVNIQPESVAQSVLVRELEAGFDAYQNDHELRRKLKGKVRTRIGVRSRKGGMNARVVHVSQMNDGAVFNPADKNIGPASQAANLELVQVVKCVMSELNNPIDQKIAELCLFGDIDCNAAAKVVNLSHAAVRKRLSRLRRRLCEILLEPVRSRVSARDWTVAAAVFVERCGRDVSAKIANIEVTALDAKLEQLGVEMIDILGASRYSLLRKSLG